VRIGIIGSGRIGGTLARLFAGAGHEVAVSNSRGPETLAGLVEELGPDARATTPAEAARFGELVVVSIPLGRYREVPTDGVDGKVVIDTNNYYPQRDGHIGALDDGTATSSGLLQEHLPTSRVVKAFNHIPARDIVERRTPEGTPHRRALVVAGDDAGAREVVARFIGDIGFDVVDLGPLAESWRIEPGTPGYGPDLDVAGLRDAVAQAERSV
jgi:8-hydroxy-5-deazaflavin:NADPH oxidoreductase